MFENVQRIEEDQAIREISHTRWAILTPIGYRALLNATDSPEMQVVAETIFTTGLRLPELLRLRVADVNFSTRLLSISNPRSRYIPLPVHLANRLDKYHREHDTLVSSDTKFFIDKKGRTLNIERVTRALHKAGKQLDWRHRITPSMLRQTFVMHALDYGIPHPILMKLLGYSRIREERMFTDIRTQMKQTLPTLELIYETLIMCTDRLNTCGNQILECPVELGEQNGHKYIGLIRTETHSAYPDAEDDSNNGDQIVANLI